MGGEDLFTRISNFANWKDEGFEQDPPSSDFGATRGTEQRGILTTDEHGW
jgi:hypothetical protein